MLLHSGLLSGCGGVVQLLLRWQSHTGQANTEAGCSDWHVHTFFFVHPNQVIQVVTDETHLYRSCCWILVLLGVGVGQYRLAPAYMSAWYGGCLLRLA